MGISPLLDPLLDLLSRFFFGSPFGMLLHWMKLVNISKFKYSNVSFSNMSGFVKPPEIKVDSNTRFLLATIRYL